MLRDSHQSERPLVESEAGISDLSGLGVGQAFRKIVLEDPEVVACREVLGDEYASIFETGQVPGCVFINYKWPLDLTETELAYYFVRPPVFFEDSPKPNPSPQIVKVSIAIADRWNRLRQRLISGDLRAKATFVRTGVVQEIDSYQWGREGLLLDVRSSDLYETENNKPVLRWSGVSLFHVKPLAHVAVPSSTMSSKEERELASSQVQGGQTAQRDSIETAIASLWPDGVPKGLLKKARDQQIIDWQKEAGLTQCSPRTISRYFKDKS